MVLPGYQVWNCSICMADIVYEKFFFSFLHIEHHHVILPFSLAQMIIKTVTAILAVFLEAFGLYCEGEFKWSCG